MTAEHRISTEDDYLVAGRSLGPVLVTFTVFATWFGAEVRAHDPGLDLRWPAGAEHREGHRRELAEARAERQQG